MEHKRIDLITVEQTNNEKKVKKRIPTFRFNLTLTDSTDQKCPEFSYKDLMKNALGSEEDSNQDPLDPFASKDKAEDDKLMAIAKAFEEKYAGKYSNGIKPNGKKIKLKDELEDLVDHGEGYDLEDSFIDNTEAYDEIIPSNMTTKLGGFYINSGALDFKMCSDSEDDFQPTQKKRKKNQITSDSDSESIGKKKKKKKLSKDEKLKKKSDSESGNKVKKKKKLISSEKLKMKKLKKTNPILYWKIQLENMQKQKNAAAAKPVDGQNAANSNATEANKTKAVSDSAPFEVNAAGVIPKSEKNEEMDRTKSQAAKITSSNVANSDTTLKNNKEVSGGNSNSNSVIIDITSQDNCSNGPHPAPKPKLENIPSLPDTLSLKTLANIEKLKQAAKDWDPGQRSTFFSSDVNGVLMQVEKDAKQIAQAERSVIYTHLGAYLPYSRETLMKRAKKLVVGQQDDKLKEPINQLKQAITDAMPAMLEKHQADCAVNDQLNLERSQNEKSKDGVNTESEDEKEGTGEKDDKDDSSTPKMKKIPAPRKKFDWTPQIRQLLCKVVFIKMEHYEIFKGRTETAEEYLKAFLDTEILKLWPKGWMQTRTLFKESRAAHSKWTNIPVKGRKSNSSTKTLPSVSTNIPAKSNSFSSPTTNATTPNNISTKSIDDKITPVNIKSSIFSNSDFVGNSTNKSNISNNKMTVKKLDGTQVSTVHTLLEERNNSGKVQIHSNEITSIKLSTNDSLKNTVQKSTTPKPYLNSYQNSSDVQRKVLNTSSGSGFEKKSVTASTKPTISPAEKSASVDHPIKQQNTDFLQKFQEFATGKNIDQATAVVLQRSLMSQGVNKLGGSIYNTGATNQKVIGDPLNVSTSVQNVPQKSKQLQRKPSLGQSKTTNTTKVFADMKQQVSHQSVDKGNVSKQYTNSSAMKSSISVIPISKPVKPSITISNNQQGSIPSKYAVLTTKADGSKQLKHFITKAVVHNTVAKQQSSHLRHLSQPQSSPQLLSLTTAAKNISPSATQTSVKSVKNNGKSFAMQTQLQMLQSAVSASTEQHHGKSPAPMPQVAASRVVSVGSSPTAAWSSSTLQAGNFLTPSPSTTPRNTAQLSLSASPSSRYTKNKRDFEATSHLSAATLPGQRSPILQNVNAQDKSQNPPKY